MTGTTKKMRALILAALMVLSVFAGTIALSGTAAAAVNLTSGQQTVWLGQDLVYSGATPGNTYEVRENTTGTLVSQIDANSTGYVNVDTSLTGTGKFYLEDPSNNVVAAFEVVEQSFTVEASPTTVENQEGDSNATFDVSSNRADYDIYVTATNIGTSDLASYFPAGTATDTDGDGTDDAVLLTGSNSKAYVGNFTDLATGNYTLTFDVADTDASSTVDLEVQEPTAAAVSFDDTVFINERGDAMAMTLSFDGAANTANVTIGDSTDVNYEVTLQVEDTNDDGVVVLTWATGDTADDNTSGVVNSTSVGSGDTILSSEVVDGVSEPVETGEYPVSVEVGGDLTDLATAIVEERQTTGVSVSTAPGATSGNLGVLQADASQDNTIAATSGGGFGDWVILTVEASGLGSFVTDETDLVAGSGSGVTLTITEDSSTVGRNADPASLTATQAASAGTFVADSENDTYYVAFPASALTSQAEGQVGDLYNVVFTVSADNPVTTEEEQVTASFELVQGESSFDTQASQIFLEAEDGATVTGTSTWAAGTELTARLTSEGGETPFVVDNEGTVAADGTWSTTFDMADKAEGQPFSASLTHEQGLSQASDVPGVIGALSATVTFSDQVATESGTGVVVDSVTLSNGGFIAIHEGGPTGDVIGHSGHLSAGSHSDVKIRLTEALTGETTLVAMAHKDTDQDKTYDFGVTDGAEDGPYMSGGSAVTSSATVSLTEDTSTPTDTPTEPPATDTPTEGDGDDETPPPDTPTTTPGFGLVVALIALAGAALLALRRD